MERFVLKNCWLLKIGLAALPTQLDPDRSIGIASIKLFYNIFDTLLFTDKEGNITGQLADSWEWQDDTTLNVKIRENVTFQNGEVCDAEDVKFTFDRILSGYGDGTIAVLYETLDGLEWDMTYCENQIMPFRAGDLKVTE